MDLIGSLDLTQGQIKAAGRLLFELCKTSTNWTAIQCRMRKLERRLG